MILRGSNEEPSRTSDRYSPHKPPFDASQPIVTVKVGDGTLLGLFYVHRAVLCASSGFFKVTLKPEWSTTGFEQISLPEYDPQVFNLYVNWLYMGAIVRLSLEVGDHDEEAQSEEWLLMAEAYVLVEALVDSAFGREQSEHMRFMSSAHNLRETFWPEAGDVISIVFGGTTVRSSARDFLMEIYLQHAGHEPAEEELLEMPEDFLVELERASRCIAAFCGGKA